MAKLGRPALAGDGVEVLIDSVGSAGGERADAVAPPLQVWIAFVRVYESSGAGSGRFLRLERAGGDREQQRQSDSEVWSQLLFCPQ